MLTHDKSSHSCHVCFKLAYWFQREKKLNISPIGSYIKTMFADSSHLGWRSGSLHIILKVDHLRTIHAMFVLNWLIGFRVRLLKKISIGSYVKTMFANGSHLGWRSGSLHTILKVDHLRTIHAMFVLNWLIGFRVRLLNIFSIGSIRVMAAILNLRSANDSQV